MTFYSNYGDVVLYSIIEARSIRSSSILSGLDAFSVFIFTIFICLGPILFFVHIKLLLRRKAILEKQGQPLSSAPEEIKEFDAKNSGFQVMFGTFKATSLLNQGALLFFVLRMVMAEIIIGVLYNYPHVQATLLTGLNTLTILYMLVMRPFSKTFNLIQNLFGEIVLLTVNFSVLIQTFIDNKEGDSTSPRYMISQTVIVCGLVFKMALNVFLALKIILRGVEAYIDRRYKRDNRASSIEAPGSTLNISDNTPIHVQYIGRGEMKKSRFSEMQTAQLPKLRDGSEIIFSNALKDKATEKSDVKTIQMVERREFCHDERKSSLTASKNFSIDVTPQENHQQDRSFVNLLDRSSSMIEEKSHDAPRNVGPKGLKLFIEQKMK